MIRGFSKLSTDEKINLIAQQSGNPSGVKKLLRSFHHNDSDLQSLFEQISENTISNFYLPYNVAPNFVINGNSYIIPMVTEESSVVAASSKSAKFWASNGGFRTNIISTIKKGQVHMLWHENKNILADIFPKLKSYILENTRDVTEQMKKRGGGIQDIKLIDKTGDLERYYQLDVSFETVDAMGANFINTVLEKIATLFQASLKTYVNIPETGYEIIMSILSNYTPECLVECSVECSIESFSKFSPHQNPTKFARKFEAAANIAKTDISRATTHNKGIYNGIDAVALATGNDWRAIEAAGHAYAARDGQYRALTDISLSENIFRYTLTVPLAIGTVGGLTNIHPLAKFSLELLKNPGAKKLMAVMASAGMANNFAAVASLVTSGIQKGHMKLHLTNILKQLHTDAKQTQQAMEYFKDKTVSFSAVKHFLSEQQDNTFVE